MEQSLRRVTEADLHELALGTVRISAERRKQIEEFLGGVMSLERGMGLVDGWLHALEGLRAARGPDAPEVVALEDTVAVLAARLTSPNQPELRPLYEWAKQQFTEEELRDTSFLEGPFVPFQDIIAELEENYRKRNQG